MKQFVAVGVAVVCCFGCSSIRPASVIWEPATVRIASQIVINVFKANGDCEPLVTLEAVVLSPESSGQQKAYFKPWGPDTWEDGKLYEVEIGHQLVSKGEKPTTFIRQKPNKAPEPTPTSVMPRANERRIE